MKRITLQISDEDFRFAKAQAGAYGYLDAADYLNGLLKAALVDRMDEYEKHGLFRLPDTPVDGPEFIEDPGGGVWHESNYPGKIDDDIPF